MAKYTLKNSLTQVRMGDKIFIHKRMANTTSLKIIVVSRNNINQLIEDNIVKQVDEIAQIDYKAIEKLIKEKFKNTLSKIKIIRQIAIEIDKYYNDNISEQSVWYYVDDSKIKKFYSDINFNYYNGNGYGLFRNEFEANFAKNLAESILNGKQESKKC